MNFDVLGTDWKILFVNANNANLLRSDNVYTIGVCDNNDKTIYINNQLKGGLLNKVLTHEITHAYIFESGIYIDIDTEEIICDFMATYGRDILGIADFVFDKLLRRVI